MSTDNFIVVHTVFNDERPDEWFVRHRPSRRECLFLSANEAQNWMDQMDGGSLSRYHENLDSNSSYRFFGESDEAYLQRRCATLEQIVNDRIASGNYVTLTGCLAIVYGWGLFRNKTDTSDMFYWRSDHGKGNERTRGYTTIADAMKSIHQEEKELSDEDEAD